MQGICVPTAHEERGPGDSLGPKRPVCEIPEPTALQSQGWMEHPLGPPDLRAFIGPHFYQAICKTREMAAPNQTIQDIVCIALQSHLHTPIQREDWYFLPS